MRTEPRFAISIAMPKSRPQPIVTGYFHPPSSSIFYLVQDPDSAHAAIVDPVLDYDEKAGRVSTESADALLAEIKKRGLTIDWILDTHPHADHLSAAAYLKSKLGAPTAIGEKIVEVQQLWRGIYNLKDLPCDGSQWDRLFKAGDEMSIGSLPGTVLFSPGHTLASITYVFGDCAFVHDTLFQPDYGTARTDFPGGNAAQLYQSIQEILALQSDTRLFTGHDYQPGGRPLAFESTVERQRQQNPYVKGNLSRDDFVKMREARDRSLPMPKLILHALQVNLRGGRLPEPEDNGKSFLKIPLDAL
jgi:glyoxylase-like metal-dependent hydrolase (beta-lactamase superfamily II)